MVRLQAPPLGDASRIDELELWCRAQGLWPVLGTDEVGRGPLAGPVVAAAVVLGEVVPPGLNDSKKLTESAREKLVPQIEASALAWAIEPAWPDEIDDKNILGASLAAMQRACERVVADLEGRGAGLPAVLLIDGNQPLRQWNASAQATAVQGDGRSLAIAAASVLAKVWRDRYMVEAETQYPGYGFAQHKGYPTPAHLAALQSLGPCPLHRRSFAPVRQQGLFGDVG
ncbi:MAG: ribonuclease HII [Deltaproteobacteria bacterium]|nr:ribonuclease HII [Deltaproteobacteria bacterium]